MVEQMMEKFLRHAQSFPSTNFSVHLSPKSFNSTLFDDYGRSISLSSGRDSSASSNSSKIVTAVPKADVQEDAAGGVQKFRIGLDGLRTLDPSTSRTLRIYSLENITRCEKLDSSILAFWSKTPVDIDAKRIRLQSNSYTTNTLLDTVTAAVFQVPKLTLADLLTQLAEKKKGLGDWMNIIKLVPDEAVSKCTSCGSDFEVSQRLSNAKESASRNVSVQSHEDLARKLQEEMQKNRKSSGSREGSGRRMKDVACPTVHLQVQVPISGSETIECGVCQNPFLVSAH
ncbi:hypothetical protein BRARA_F01433 [Brassica rapa]|uniref:Uncharacterized protein n=1 Tax=Brassica campestris TaxID=3711 RepID=A0A397YXQ0_BRACM|nr:hypothetical protein BRARA_F01433 [Brassica rapa]